MTEAEWLAATDPMPMLEFLKGKPSDRKLRLVACACVHRLGGHLKDERSKQALELAERFADGTANKAELRRARQAVRAAQEGLVLDLKRRAEGSAYEVVALAATEKDFVKAIPESWPVARLQATGIRVAREPFPSILLREIIGNPFRPITLNPSWLTSTVLALATGIYDEKGFDRLPILADALQDADCDNEEILNHFRQPGEHCRGCWALDLVLGKG
jgi:hypothetical protein